VKRSRRKPGGVAQLGEHLPCKQGVKSSNLSISILIRRKAKAAFLREEQCFTSDQDIHQQMRILMTDEESVRNNSNTSYLENRIQNLDRSRTGGSGGESGSGGRGNR
jgi:hypothetical protein